MKKLTDNVLPKPDPHVAQRAPRIEGVVTRVLKPLPDERGRLMEIMRTDWPEFMRFAHAYMTTAYPGVTKAWHYHHKQVDHFICVSGMMKLVLYDGRKKSETYGILNEFFVGEHNPLLVRIPAWVYHGFKCIGRK